MYLQTFIILALINAMHGLSLPSWTTNLLLNYFIWELDSLESSSCFFRFVTKKSLLKYYIKKIFKHNNLIKLLSCDMKRSRVQVLERASCVKQGQAAYNTPNAGTPSLTSICGSSSAPDYPFIIIS